jgi:hypothetical protein
MSLLVQSLEHFGTLSRTRISDIQFMLISIDILPGPSDIVILLVRIRLSIFIIRSQEEVNSRRLNLCIWVENGQRNDRDGLGVGPDFLLPKFPDHHDGPHGFSTLLLALSFTLVTDYFGAHTAFYHPEKETLDDTVQTVVLGLCIGSLQVGEDRLSDDGS